MAAYFFELLLEHQFLFFLLDIRRKCGAFGYGLRSSCKMHATCQDPNSLCTSWKYPLGTFEGTSLVFPLVAKLTCALCQSCCVLSLLDLGSSSIEDLFLMEESKRLGLLALQSFSSLKMTTLLLASLFFSPVSL